MLCKKSYRQFIFQVQTVSHGSNPFVPRNYIVVLSKVETTVQLAFEYMLYHPKIDWTVSSRPEIRGSGSSPVMTLAVNKAFGTSTMRVGEPFSQ